MNINDLSCISIATVTFTRDNFRIIKNHILSNSRINNTTFKDYITDSSDGSPVSIGSHFEVTLFSSYAFNSRKRFPINGNPTRFKNTLNQVDHLIIDLFPIQIVCIIPYINFIFVFTISINLNRNTSYRMESFPIFCITKPIFLKWLRSYNIYFGELSTTSSLGCFLLSMIIRKYSIVEIIIRDFVSKISHVMTISYNCSSILTSSLEYTYIIVIEFNFCVIFIQ